MVSKAVNELGQRIREGASLFAGRTQAHHPCPQLCVFVPLFLDDTLDRTCWIGKEFSNALAEWLNYRFDKLMSRIAGKTLLVPWTSVEAGHQTFPGCLQGFWTTRQEK